MILAEEGGMIFAAAAAMVYKEYGLRTVLIRKFRVQIFAYFFINS